MSDPQRRIGNSEREAAVAALQAHLTAGRLDSSEYEDRSLQARQARTQADLVPLFADLPQPHPEDTATPSEPSDPAPPASGAQPPARPAAASPAPVPDQTGGLLPEPWGAWVMSLTPFAALILFFATGHHWQWFLIIPIAGLVVYGPGGHHGDRGRVRDRHDRRDR